MSTTDSMISSLDPGILAHFSLQSNISAEFTLTLFKNLLATTDAQVTSDLTAGISHALPEHIAPLLADLITSVRQLLEESKHAPDAGTTMTRFTGSRAFRGGSRSLLAARLQLLAAVCVQGKLPATQQVVELLLEATDSSNLFVRTEAFLGLAKMVSTLTAGGG
jgi:secreted trypsin-like serine protease